MFTFSAIIYNTGGPGTVSYAWVRNGHQASPQSVTLPSNGEWQVSDSVTLNVDVEDFKDQLVLLTSPPQPTSTIEVTCYVII